MPESPDPATGNDPTPQRALTLLREILEESQWTEERAEFMRDLAEPDGRGLGDWIRRADQR